jgi:hypothetical protein
MDCFIVWAEWSGCLFTADSNLDGRGDGRIHCSLNSTSTDLKIELTSRQDILMSFLFFQEYFSVALLQLLSSVSLQFLCFLRRIEKENNNENKKKDP